MKYIVVRPKGELSVVFIMPEGRDVTLPFESWALRDGKQIVFATIKMHKVLQSHHFAGSYEQGAMYAYTYEEMCAIMTSNLGPSDRERYEAGLKEQSTKTLIKDIPVHDTFPKWMMIGIAIWKFMCLGIMIFIKALNTVLFLVLLPLLIKWFNGFNK